MSIGAWGVPDFERRSRLVDGTAPGCGTTIVCGTGSNRILNRNFQALKVATGADAVNFDDESAYDLAPTTTFIQMLIGMGDKITFAPYTQQMFWRHLGSAVDRTYLQVYAGGAGNIPASWNTAMGMTVAPGLWSRNGSGCASGDSPATVQPPQTSSNGSTWSTPVTVSNNTGGTSTHALTATSARYIRLNVTTPTQNSAPATRIYEFDVR